MDLIVKKYRYIKLINDIREWQKKWQKKIMSENNQSGLTTQEKRDKTMIKNNVIDNKALCYV